MRLNLQKFNCNILIVNTFFFFLFLSSFSISAQNEKLIIQKILLSGNKRTLDNTIKRELTFHENDTLQLKDLDKIIQFNKSRILGTGIANQININLKNWDTESGKTDVLVEIKEAIFLYPIPIAELADRNFNVWIKEQKASISRLNIGTYTYWLNASGRAELMKFTLLFGYTNKFEFNYIQPALNTKRTIGINLNLHYSSSKELGYDTQNNKLVFKRLNEPAIQKQKYTVGVFYRPEVFTNHTFSISYQKNNISDSIINSYNEDFLGKSIHQNYFSAKYQLDIDKRNLKVFATKGFKISTYLQKDGIFEQDDLNRIIWGIGGEKYWALSQKWNIDLKMKAQLTHYFNDKIPYYTNKALGYEKDYLRGYEYYVVDGQKYYWGKTNLKYLILDKIIHWGKIMPIPKLRNMPVQFFPSLNFDAGYVDNKLQKASNYLQNTFLFSYGFGWNTLLYNNKLIQIEYSINHLNEKALFLHYDIGF